MKFTYNIAGLPVESDFSPGPAYDNFITDSERDSHGQFPAGITFVKCNVQRESSPLFSVSQEQFNVCAYADGFLFESPLDHGAKVFSNLSYTECKVAEGPGLEHLIRLVLESRLIHEGKITLHSSCISAPDGAFCLTGVSGVGKSTRAAAFCEMPGFELISGDRPLIDCICPDAYGVPWDGKEALFINKRLPLRAVFCVRRLDETENPCRASSGTIMPAAESLRLLTEKGAYQQLIVQTFLPMWDTDTAAMAMGNLKKLVSHLGIYELTSGPDSESAKKSWEIIRKEVMYEDK